MTYCLLTVALFVPKAVQTSCCCQPTKRSQQVKDKENDIFILAPEPVIQGIKLCQPFSPSFLLSCSGTRQGKHLMLEHLPAMALATNTSRGFGALSTKKSLLSSPSTQTGEKSFWDQQPSSCSLQGGWFANFPSRQVIFLRVT